MWLTENGVGNPSDYLPTSPDPISTFIDYYPGGWQEVFPNGGPTSQSLGAVFGQHGEVAHMPWDYRILTDSADEIAVEFSVRPRKIPVTLKKTMSLTKGSPSLSITEEIYNLSDTTLQYMWGHHITFGKPFLSPGCRIELPQGLRIIAEGGDEDHYGRIPRGKEHHWPLTIGWDGQPLDLSQLPPKGSPSDIVYLTGFDDEGWYKVVNPDIHLGVQVTWNTLTLPYLWFWQEYGGTHDYPWYGRHYNVGLEPFSSYPTGGLLEAITNGSARTLTGKSRQSVTLSYEPFAV